MGEFLLRYWLVLIVVVGLVACSQEENGATPDATRVTTGAVMATSTARVEAAATATVAPSPTPNVPAVTAATQRLAEDGRLSIASVNALNDGWLVVYAVEEGAVGDVLGHTAVAAGRSENVTLTIDPMAATATLMARLHADEGESGSFEFPGVDMPVEADDEVVSTEFDITFAFTRPAIIVSDQEIGEDGILRVDSVAASEPGWLLVHAAEADKIGAILGQIFVEAGEHEELAIPIRWREATPALYLVLYEDKGRSRRLDYPDEDLPVLVNGQPLVAEVAVTYPPDILVYDQPIVDETVTVNRVISKGPGWLAIYFDDGGELGLIIGVAPLADGLNEDVVVEVTQSAVTDPLYIVLHEDTEPGDEFDFPRVDRPVFYNERVPAPFSFRTSPGNYLITADQIVPTGTVTATLSIPLAVTDIDAWVVVYSDSEGEADNILGQSWIPAGFNQAISVTIDMENATETLYAILQQDAGAPQVFDFPNGVDTPMQRNRNVILAPLQLLPEN